MATRTMMCVALVFGGLSLLTTGCKDAPKQAPQASPEASAVAPAAVTATKAKTIVHADASSWLRAKMDQVHAHAPLAPVNAEEAVFAKVERDLLKPWKAAWLKRDGGAFAGLLAAKATGTAFDGGERTLVREMDGITETRWTLDVADALQASVSGYLDQFSDVEYVDLEVTKFRATSETAATLSLRLDGRGKVADGGLRHDRGLVDVTATRTDAGWRAATLNASEMETVAAAATRKPTFADATTVAGLDTIPVVSRSEAIRRGGYAMAVADYDGDRKPDVLLGHYGPMQLLRNTGEGFEDVTAAAGLRGDDLVKAAAFADMDNDGHRDLVLLRFVSDPKATTGDLVAYRNNGDGTFEHKGDILTRARQYDRPMPLAIADFDNNGFLDLYIGFPGARDFTNNLARDGRGSELEAQNVWLNDGSWSLKEMPRESDLLADKHHTFPHAALVSDLDQDGDSDLIVVVDSGLESPVYNNAGEGEMRRVKTGTGLNFTGYGMAAASADYDGDGFMDVVMTRIYLGHGRRLADSWKDRTDDPEMKDNMRENYGAFEGNVLFRNKGDGTFESATEIAGVGHAGLAPAGVNFVDYNGDGKPDIYVSNGLWSGGEEDFSSAFFRMEMVTSTDELDHAMAPPTSMGAPNPFLEALREFKGSLDDPKAAASDKPTLSFAGYQRNRLFRNNGDGSFSEVGYLEGADRIEDGYVAAAADFDGDGRQDLMLRNCDPAPGVKFNTVTLLKNQGTNFNTLTVFAEGDKSNRDGIGVIVTAMIDGKPLVREIQSTAGAIQGEPVAYFGLADKTRVDSLEVRWPSGLVERFDGVEAGKVMLREGKGMIDLAAATR